MNVALILSKLTNCYGQLSSYRDAGTKRTTMHPEGINFRTYFVRPGLFRLDWVDDGFNTVWCDGDSAYLHLALEKKRRRIGSLQLAVAAATGISSGVAHDISVLLSPLVGGTKVTEHEFEYAGAEEIDGERCHWLCYRCNEDELNLHISDSRNVIRKISEVSYVDYKAVLAEMLTKLDSDEAKESFDELKGMGLCEPNLESLKQSLRDNMDSQEVYSPKETNAVGRVREWSESIFKEVVLNQPIDPDLFNPKFSEA